MIKPDQAPEASVVPFAAPRKTVTLIPGDGIGPEVSDAVVRVLAMAGVPLDFDSKAAGGRVFATGDATGVPEATIASLRRTRLALKGPLETPIGHGAKSANVTLRKLFETYGNVRPIRELPGIETPFSGRGIDLVIVRENVEDLYAGIEHMQTPDVAQCLKLISRKGCEKIARLAFEIARAEERPSVTCATKANIMKLTEGMMKRVFFEVAADYPDIRAEHMLIDACAARLVSRPESFDVIVTTNMNGDILSDLGAALVGGLGFAPSVNLGDDIAIFEAVHGSAPDIAGRGVANPTALLLSAIMMLRYLGMGEKADAVEDALMLTLKQGEDLTPDMARPGSPPATTRGFVKRIAANLGPAGQSARGHLRGGVAGPLSGVGTARSAPSATVEKKVVGIDVFLDSGLSPDELGHSLERLAAQSAFGLKMISNRGTKVFPSNGAETDLVDHWRCRFMMRASDGCVGDAQIFALLSRIGKSHRWVHVEKLQLFDGKPAFSLAQGEAAPAETPSLVVAAD